MKKLVQINVVCNGSTGKIMHDLAVEAKKNGFETHCFFGRGEGYRDIDSVRISGNLFVYIHLFLARLGFNGWGSYFSTKRLVKKLKKINPDIIHLHNIHGYYLNLKVLFKYLKEFKGKIIWTLHDCWTFTGHCAYFTLSGCKKWQTKCHHCSNLKTYPKTIFDRSKQEYKLKQELFTSLNNLTIVTPSIWLKDLVKLSFLKKYPVQVINNGIDLDIFKPIKDENIYQKYSIPKDKKIILGVANIWEERKGLKDFLELAKIIKSDYQIVLVGVDSKTKKKLPSQIIAIERTENQSDLAKLYTLAEVFFNPTYEDNFPTTNLESIACQTPVITYDTGGSYEAVKKFGLTIKPNDLNNFFKILDEIKTLKPKKDLLNEIDKTKKYQEYITLYEEEK